MSLCLAHSGRCINPDCPWSRLAATGPTALRVSAPVKQQGGTEGKRSQQRASVSVGIPKFRPGGWLSLQESSASEVKALSPSHPEVCRLLAGTAPWGEALRARWPAPLTPPACAPRNPRLPTLRPSPAAPGDQDPQGCPPPPLLLCPSRVGVRARSDAAAEPHRVGVGWGGRGPACGTSRRRTTIPSRQREGAEMEAWCACALHLSSMATVLSRALKLPGKGSAPAGARERRAALRRAVPCRAVPGRGGHVRVCSRRRGGGVAAAWGRWGA